MTGSVSTLHVHLPVATRVGILKHGQFARDPCRRSTV